MGTRLTILGTGTSQGVPIIGCTCKACHSLDFRDKRLRTSAYLEVGNTCFLIDAGPDLRQQAMRAGIKRIDAVILTHEHRDHTAGLDELRAYNYIQKDRIPVFAWPRVLQQIRRDYEYAFAENPYPGTPQLDLLAINGVHQNILGVDFTFPTVIHGLLPVLSIVVGGLAYVTDAKTISNDNLALLKNAEILVINALQHEDHISHFTLAEALQAILHLQPERTFLTHLSHRLGTHLAVEASLPVGVRVGYDGLVLSIN